MLNARATPQVRAEPQQALLEHPHPGRLPPRPLIEELIEDSYDLVVAGLPRAERLKLDWPGERGREG
ncbi:hypothetical protein SCATT_p10120 (plasmid) [Streptantibioticus cattleyicolor NRRL 8057 = DSM 46488]|uniref:Uncharacterized protein n=1 Tax=Streptantibioticus cattleyicolor (strain ATCC 35852 / DSM 46488 / JCM 4925 / NBRC 14057 / NRRL 8057) TaxID=1003195 RepID=G8XDX0_STREN|nr:hypothetical protein SCATT_p10120 [Streptantibioticus cattleyicolor NRRL 8057 = DSM 46488]